MQTLLLPFGMALKNANFTGKELVHGTTWKVIRTAYDVMGNKWYDLGANQWIMAKYTVEGGNAASAQVATPVAPQAQAPVQQAKPATPAASQQASAQPAQAQTKQAPVASTQQTTQVQAPVQQKQQTAVQAQAPKTNYNYNVQRAYSAPVQQQKNLQLCSSTKANYSSSTTCSNSSNY